MRIVSGKYGGIPLLTPKNKNIRPTSDKVRGAIFNILRGYGVLTDASVLDCFCGTGALGLEALSQGATHITFIDKHIQLAKDNAEKLKTIENCTFIKADATKAIVNNTFDLVFCDPPYGQGLAEKALANMVQQNALNDKAVIMIEEAAKTTINLPSDFDILDTRIYGDTQIMLARYHHK